MFNESFSTAVERLGGERWLAAHGSELAKREYAVFDGRRRQFRALCLTTRYRLEAIYQQEESPVPDKRVLASMKSLAMQAFRDDYARQKSGWGGWAGYDAWVASANNAMFGAQAAYDELVPAFEILFAREGQDWRRFYAALKQLAQMPAAQRTQTLKQLSAELKSG